MIGKLSGVIDSVGDDWVIVDVGGVGYLVYASARTLGSLAAPGAPVSLLIETHVREDQIRLFGFADKAEHDWFRLLLTVQGVGTRHALAILTVLAPHDLARAIAVQDKAALSRASGVGPKLAGRVATELKDKVGDFLLGPVLVQENSDGDIGGEAEDAVSALINLGYRRNDALGVVTEASRRLGPQARVETLIREGLKELAS